MGLTNRFLCYAVQPAGSQRGAMMSSGGCCPCSGRVGGTRKYAPHCMVLCWLTWLTHEAPAHPRRRPLSFKRCLKVGKSEGLPDLQPAKFCSSSGWELGSVKDGWTGLKGSLRKLLCEVIRCFSGEDVFEHKQRPG